MTAASRDSRAAFQLRIRAELAAGCRDERILAKSSADVLLGHDHNQSSIYDVRVRVGPADVLQLGDPALRVVSDLVGDVTGAEFGRQRELLHAVLDAFRSEKGFGRAIAAPQIGIARRFVAVCLGDRRRTLVDPEIVECSRQTFRLWDDCMSFPDLLVRVRRHERITVRYTDEGGRRVEWGDLGRATSELLQHELDHLDGVLAVDRALDRQSLVTREAFARDPEYFATLVD